MRAPLLALVGALALLVLAFPALSKKPKPVPCPEGRFLLPAGTVLVPGGPPVDLDAVIVDESAKTPAIGIASGCDPGPGSLKATKKGTVVKGHWAACGTAVNVKLAARIETGCVTMTGTVKAKRQKKRAFTAVRSTCGDGVVDPGAGEQCEAEVDDCPDLPCENCLCPGTGTTTSTLAGGSTTTSSTTPGGGSTTTTTLPTVPAADPSTVAPPHALGTGVDFSNATAFLYGPGGPQVNVTPGSLAPARMAVLRGRVLDTTGAALPAVLVSIVGHPEWGQTLSRADGMFDMAVNGGAQLLVSYRKAGYVEVQRPGTPGFNDWDLMPDVVMTALDAQVTAVTLAGATQLQTAQGSPVTDTDGTRQATVLFPAGTTADMVMPDGSTHALGTLHVRATEFTVGSRGQAAMPGPLPATSGYTYAVELSVDEAIAAGATEVRFNNPVPLHVDNFLGFPVGTLVPVGVYDRGDGMWKAVPNGRVIKVLSATGGLADLDLDGDDVADGAPALAALGITDAERQQLATLYPAGHTLWRSLLPHFSAYDCNWSKLCGPTCVFPPDPDPRKRKKPDDHARKHPCVERGSVLSCESQTIGEKVAVAGTPFTLRYTSARARGHRNRVQIPLTGATISPKLVRVHATASVAGQEFTTDVAAAPNLSFDFLWDGNDAYGRPFRSAPHVTGRIDYEYSVEYGTSDDPTRQFADTGTHTTQIVGRGLVDFSTDFAFDLDGAGPFADDRSLGGWSLDANHRYDPLSGTVYFGDGAELQPPAGRATLVLGSGEDVNGAIPAAGVPATSVGFIPSEIQPAPDGGFYAINGSKLFRIGTDGIVRPVFCPAGGSCLPPADGVLASQANLTLQGIKTGPDGLLYGVVFNSGHGSAIWRIERDDTLHLVAGSANPAQAPAIQVGGDARNVSFRIGSWVAVGPEGSVYFYSQTTKRLWRVTPAGRLAIVAGSGATPTTAFSGDGGPALDATFVEPYALAADSQGNVYFTVVGADLYTDQNLVVRVRPDGIIERFAGGGCSPDPSSTTEGVGRLVSCLRSPGRLDLGPDGTPYLSEGTPPRVYRLGEIVTAVTGGVPGSNLPGVPPEAVAMGFTNAFAFSRHGSLLVGTTGYQPNAQTPPFSGVREIEFRPPTLADGSVVVPTGSGAVHVFDASGRHVSTRDRFTGALVYQFGYDAGGALVSVTDAAGNVTTITRAGNGTPTAIVAPGGQHTTLTLDANGYLHTISDAGGHAVTLGYAGVADGFAADSGLLKTFALPSGATSTFGYDADGNLVSDTNALGGTTTLARAPLPNGFQLTTTGPTGETTVRRLLVLDDGTVERHVVGPAGGETIDTLTPAGLSTVTYDDGTVVTVQTAGDPRFGSYLPVASSTTVKKGFLQNVTTDARTITTPGTTWLGIDVLTETRKVSGLSWTAVFDGPQKTITRTSPAGRVRTATVDASGRPTQVVLDANYAPTSLAWNAKGLLGQVGRGAQHRTYAYDARNRLASLTDAGSRVHAFTFDTADRPITASFPGNEVTALAWDADANLAGFTPPGGAAHTLASDGLGNETSYTPPGNPAYQRQYRTDGSLEKVTLPSGHERAYGVDAGGRPTGIAYPEATVAYTYAGTSTFPATVSRTPTGAGQAHTLTYTYQTDLPKTVAASGAATGTYTYTYDGFFLPSNVSLQSGADNVAYAITRDADLLTTHYGPLTLTRGGPDGGVSAITDGTSTLALTYSPEGQTATRGLTANTQSAYTVVITHDTSGLPTARTETVGATTITWGYTYDARGRLTGVTRNGTAVEAYAYDANGNRTSAAYDGGAAATATYDAQDRLATRGATTYAFDDDGALAARGADTFTYSAAGELLSATVGASIVTYDYDGLNRRVRRTAGAAVTEYLYGDLGDPFRVTAYRAPDGTLTTLLYDEAGLLVAFERSGQRFFVATDQVGSPRVVANVAGAAVRVVEYDAFGRIRSDSAPSFDLPIGFAGGLADPVTGLVHFGLRDYEPASGRWTSRDPAQLGGHDFNLYAYVGSSPVGFRDPFGLWCVGGSAFDLVGFTGQLCHTKDGTSVCGGFGFGTEGHGFEFSSSGGLADDFNGFQANAGVRVRGVGTLGLDGSFGQYGDPYDPHSEPCFKSTGTVKGTFRRSEYDLLHLDQGGTKQIDLPDAEADPEPVSLEAKAIWKSCRNY